MRGFRVLSQRGGFIFERSYRSCSTGCRDDFTWGRGGSGSEKASGKSLKKLRILLQDARGLFTAEKPIEWKEGNCHIRAWDEEGFDSAEGVEAPLRVLHTEERIKKREHKNNKWVEKEEVHQWWWATTLSSYSVSSRLLWEIAHKRWEIENNLFRTLSTHWSLNHCFKHEPTALLTLFISFVLLQSFYWRNLKAERRGTLTIIALAEELYVGLVLMDLKIPWLNSG